jgi:hypothetical protein
MLNPVRSFQNRRERLTEQAWQKVLARAEARRQRHRKRRIRWAIWAGVLFTLAALFLIGTRQPIELPALEDSQSQAAGEPRQDHGGTTARHSGPVHVRAYVRKDGTVVREHTRRRPEAKNP